MKIILPQSLTVENALARSFSFAALVVIQLLWLSREASAQSLATNSVSAPLPGYALAWSDEFNGSALDAAKWTYRADSKNLSTQKPENVIVKEGLLRLTLKKEVAGGKNYTGAGIMSQPTFKYAYYEARIKMPAGAGWHNSFWLMKHDGSGTTDSQEAKQGIDVAQNDSIDHQTYTVALNKYNPLPGEAFGYQRLTAPDLATEFHVFGCEFTPQTAKFYLDGNLVSTVLADRIPHGEMNVWLGSIASHLGGTPNVDDTVLPQETQCDYIRVFTKTNEATSAK